MHQKSEDAMVDKIVDILVEKCVTTPEFNSRRKGLGDLTGLVESIKLVGVLEPLLGRTKENTAEEVEIYAGFRRLEAARLAGLKAVPIILRPRRAFTRAQLFERNLAENTHRKNLNPMDEAYAFLRMIEQYDVPEDEVHTKIGLSKKFVVSRLRLLKLEAVVSDAIHREKISVISALEIDRLPKDLQSKYVGVAETLSGMQLSKLVSKELEKLDPKDEPEKKEKPPVADVTEHIRMIRNACAILGKSLSYDDEGLQKLRELNYRILDPDDLRVLAKFFDDSADAVEDEVEVKERAASAITEAVEGQGNLALESPQVRQALIQVVIARSKELATERADGKRPKVTFTVAKDAIEEFYPHSETE